MLSIYTLTANLLWETTFTCDIWHPGQTARAENSSVQAGGKGVNVSKMLARLGATNEALIFPGGDTGRLCVKWLKEHHFSIRCFDTRHETRSGLVVRSDNHPETTFLAPDCQLDRESIESCIPYLEGLPAGSILAFCGSIPQWEAPLFDPLRAILPGLIKRHHVVIDTYGPPLEWFSQYPVALVKINAREFHGLPGVKELSSSPEDALRMAAEKWKPERWMITDGPMKVRGIDAQGKYLEKTPPPVEKFSAVGSGDVFLACLLHALFNQTMDFSSAVDFAIPYATANTASPGIADFDVK